MISKDRIEGYPTGWPIRSVTDYAVYIEGRDEGFEFIVPYSFGDVVPVVKIHPTHTWHFFKEKQITEQESRENLRAILSGRLRPEFPVIWGLIAKEEDGLYGLFKDGWTNLSARQSVDFEEPVLFLTKIRYGWL